MLVSKSHKSNLKLKNQQQKYKFHTAATAFQDEDETYSSASRRREGIEISVPNAEDLATSKASQQLARSILTIFELALLEPHKDEQRRKFAELLLALLKRW